MKKINFWEYKKEYKYLKTKGLINKIDNSLYSGEIFYGKKLNEFEKKFLKFNNSKYGIAVKTGTDALIVALIASGIKPGDEVITVSLTAIPTVSAIVSVGAKPVFVDVNDKYIINIFKIEKKISKKTKAIIPVHLYGQMCEMDTIVKIAKKNKIIVIEDCAQSQGAKYKGKYSGTVGKFGCFSFYPTKILGAYGDGGFIVCKRKKDLDLLRQISFYGLEINNKNHKKYKSYFANIHGINSRIDNIQATILSLKLDKLKKWIIKRRKIAKIYSKRLLNENKINNNHVYHLYVLRSKLRNKLKKYLISKNILTGIHYENPIHKMKGYSKFHNKNNSDLQNSEKLSREIISLPIHPFIKTSDVNRIINEIKKFNQKSKNELKSTF